MRHVYLDWNATTPPHPSVLEQMRAAFDLAWANPASVHGPGRRARAFVEDAREAVARLTRFDARDVVLTSGGTEANNLALALPFRDEPATRRRALVVSRIEHPSVVRTAQELERRGVLVAWVEPLASGVVPAEAFAEAVSRVSVDADVKLIALQAVNHETGVVQPVAEVAALARSIGALLHVDAVQAVGRLAPDAWAGADLVSVAAHKIRGPKGVGALCARPGLKIRPLLFGGAQERGVRPGTQDPIACAGFAVAASRAHESGPSAYERVAELRDRVESALLALGGLVNGEGATARARLDALSSSAGPSSTGLSSAASSASVVRRAPHVTNLSWPGWRGDELCAALDLEGVAVSSGSACSAGTAEPSPVITAMVGVARAASAVRVSLGEDTSAEDVTRALDAFARVLGRR